MRIDAELDVDVKRIAMAYDDDTAVRMMTPVVSVVVDEAQCRALFGDALARLAFADGEGAVGYDKIKPRVVSEKHLVGFAGGPQVPTIPVIDSVAPRNVEQVVVTLKLPFVVENKADVLAITMAFGEMLLVKLTPAQMELPMGEAA